MKNDELLQRAKEVTKLNKVSAEVKTGEVGCALISENDNVYVGVSIDASCGIGFCAEHSAIANMITNGEFRIKKIVAVLPDKTILRPCGRCCELIRQIHKENWTKTEVIIAKNRIVKLRELLPYPY